jgi:hypothetical protein
VSPAAPPPSAVQKSDKAPPPAPRPKPPPRPADDEPGARPVRKRRAADEGDADDRPKKSGQGKVILAVVLGLFLVCGGIVGGAIWAVYAFVNATEEAVARATSRFAPPPDDERQPAPPDKPAEPPADNGGWKTFTSREHGFSARFPDEPKKSVMKNPGDDLVKYEVALEGGAIQYTVVYHQAKVKATQTKVVLDAIAIPFDPKSIKSQQDIQLDGHPGRELVIEMEVKGVAVGLTMRTYVIKDHLLQVMVTAAKGKQDAAEAKKFFDSFKAVE